MGLRFLKLRFHRRRLYVIYNTFFSGIVLLSLYIQTSFFFVCCGSSVLKALPTCLYAGRSRGYSPPQLQFLYQSVGLDSTSSQVGGLRALTPPPPLLRKIRKPHMAPGQSTTCNRWVIFYTRRSIECVCHFQKPIFGFRHLYCWTMCAFSRSRVCLLFFSAVRHQMPHPGSFTNLIKCKDVGLLNGTPRFFLHGSFCMKKRKLVLYTNLM